MTTETVVFLLLGAAAGGFINGLSGTGTEGATIRVYLERYMPAEGDLEIETQAALAEIVQAVEELTQLRAITGRAEPDVMT